MMLRQIGKNKLGVVIVLILAFTTLYYSDALAWGGHGHGHDRYYYRGGHWYRHGWFWGGIAVGALTIGAIIASLPPRHSVVYASNVPYYYDGTYYYRSCPEGYVVVANPTVVVPATPAPVIIQSSGTNTVTINVPNSIGGYTPVILTKFRNGYIGPQGEYYEGNPTVDQLRALYGK